MTFLTDEEQRGGLLPQQAPEAQAPEPLWKELFNASLETSSVGSLAEQSTLGWQRSLPSTQQQADPNYDPFDDIQGYEQFADAFASSQSRYESDLIKRSIDKRLESQETVARGGLSGLATTLATEPLNFVPLGPVASITGRIGSRLGRYAATGAATGAVGAGLVEGALQATDPTRTAEQSAVNVALGATLGTAIGTAGAGVATFLAGRAGKAGAEFEAFKSMTERALIGENSAPSGSTGAMATRNTTIEQEAIKKGFGANYLNKLNESEFIVGNPIARTRASENLLVRQLSGELSETPYITEGNTVGIASPQAVETQIKRWQAPLAEALQDLDNQFALYRLGRQKKFGDLAKVGALDTYTQATRRTPEKLTYAQFKDEVARSMRRGDQSDNPNVAAAARSMREKVFDPLKQRAIDAGLLPADVSVETAISYLTRVYDTGKIIKQRPEFENRITNWLRNLQEDIKRQIEMGAPISEQNNIIKDFVPAAANEPALSRVQGEAQPTNAVRIVSQDTAVTPTGRRVPVDYALVDAKTLITSNTDQLTPNPNYPQELQPRDRSRGTTELQIKNIINPDRFRPELLGKTPDAATGAPIVGPDMVVQSGNARSIALRRAYGENGATAQAYRDYLTAQGFDLTGIDQPVLVRINRSNMTPEQLQAFTREANTSSILGMSATEKAAADAKALPDSVLDLAADADLTSAANRDFVRKTLQSIATQNELGQLITPQGELSQEGLRRVQGAIIAKAYDDPAVVQNILESTDSNIKAIGNGLLNAAPVWNKLRSNVRAGQVIPDFDITQYLNEAVALIDRARSEGKTVAEFIDQTDIFKGDTVSPEAELLLRIFLKGDKLEQRVGQDKIAQALRYYATEASKVEAGPGLFGASEQLRPAQILEAGRAKAQGTDINPAAAGRSDLFTRPQTSPGLATAGVGSDGQPREQQPRAIPAALEGDALASAITARPEIKQLAPDQQGALAALYKQAEEAKPVFDEIATGIVKDLEAMGIKAEVKLAPLKGANRAVEKILTEKDGNVAGVKDLVRGTIIVDNLEDAGPAFDLVKQRYALAGKERFLLDENAPSLEGYRDAFTNVNVNGHIAEMQVNVRKIADLKESTHAKYYQPIRQLRAKETAGVVTKEELDLLNQLENSQIQAFDKVWSEVLAERSARMASNSASDMRGALSTKAIDDGKTGNVDPSGLNPNKVMGSTDVSNLTGTPSKLKNLDIISPPNEKVAQGGPNVKPTAQAIRPEYVTFSQLEEGDLKAIAQEITDKIVGGAPGRSNYEPIPLTRGPLRERTLSIPDEQIEDFLENDIERVARIYTRTMSTDVELATKFGRADMADQLTQVNDSYAILRADAERTLKGKKLEARMQQLEKARRNDLADLEGMRDRIRGTYAIPSDPNSMIVRTGRAARTLNYVRLLGGMTLSAVPDIANPINRHGFGRVFGTLGSLKNKKLFNLAADEVKAAGTALDMVLDSRAMQMADIWDDYGRNSTFERGLQAAQDRFGVVSLMAPWNAAMKQFAGIMSQTRLLQEARKLAKGKIGKGERERLAFLGIDAQMAQRIAEQADNWKEDSGIIWANTSAWADRDAVEAFRNAIVKEVDMTIVTPGQDRPLWMSNEMGKVIGQFKSFAFTSLSKVAVSSLQRGDKNVMQGLVVAVALGMMVHGIKQTQSGRPMPEKPQDWIVAGLDRSGVMGWLFEANNMVEKATGGNIGVNPLLGTSKGNNRFSSRGVVGSFMGPSFGLAEDLVAVTGAAASGELGRNELEKLRRMVPFQNVPYLAWMFDQIENGAGSAMGLPPK